MKKIIYALAFLAACIPSFVQASESIESFVSTLTIQKNGQVDVQEVITYNFGENQRHGIFRNIPILYDTPSGTLHLPLINEMVTDEHGNELEYEFEELYQDERIKIGSADAYVSGIQTYVISYSVNAINYFDDHDELYWNVTGNGWEVPIKEAKAIVRLPEPIPAANVSSTCFRGYSGNTDPCDNIQQTFSGRAVSNTLFTASNLEDGEGLTVVVGFPKNKVAFVEKWYEVYVEPELTFFEKVSAFFNRPWIFGIPLIVCIYSIIRWWRFGRDPKGRGVVVAQFGPPDALTPAQVGTLVDEKTDTSDISAEIIELAVQGYITITRLPGTGLLASDDYQLDKLKEPTGLPAWQKSIMRAVFGKKKTTKLSDLKNEFVDEFMGIASELSDSLVKKKYFAEDPFSLKMHYYLRGAALGFILAFPMFFLGGWMPIIAGMSSGFIYMFIGFLMPKKTLAGVHAKEHIFGLRLYLEVAEKDRIAFHNAPKADPALFEKLLPYAMVLDVEKEWANQFKNIYTAEPRWYHDPTHGSFNAVVLATSLHSFSSRASTTFSGPTKSSASSGGSGFSGGSSGGGFGGGGGGSW